MLINIKLCLCLHICVAHCVTYTNLEEPTHVVNVSWNLFINLRLGHDKENHYLQTLRATHTS